MEGLREGGRIDAGQRDERPEAIDDERAQREVDAALKVVGLGEGAKVQIGGKLLGSGYHGSSLPTFAPVAAGRPVDVPSP